MVGNVVIIVWQIHIFSETDRGCSVDDSDRVSVGTVVSIVCSDREDDGAVVERFVDADMTLMRDAKAVDDDENRWTTVLAVSSRQNCQ